MSDKNLWSRLREARLIRLLAVYLAASWAILQVTDLFIDRLGVPEWVTPTALILLLAGLLVLLATAWVQSHPMTPRREAAEEVPSGWELDVGDLAKSVARGEMPHLTWARAAFGGFIAFALLFGLAGLYVVIKDRGQSFSPDEAIAEGAAPGIAVLPFEVSGTGLEVWRQGVVDLVGTNLDGAAGLRSIDSRTVLARWRELAPDGQSPDLETSLEIARRAGARYALLGNVVALGRDIRLTADVYEVEGGRSLGRAQVEGAPDSVYALVDRLSISVLQTILGGRAEDLPRVDLARVTTASLPALKAYLEGEVLYHRSDFEGAIPAYQRAIEADSTFALALLRLSQSYGWSENIQSDLAARYVEAASRFADRLPEREALLVRGNLALLRGNIDGIRSLQEGVRKYPDDPELWYMLADTYNHLGWQALLPKEEESVAFDRAIALDPGLAPLYIHPFENALLRADSTAARELLARHERLATGTWTHQLFRLDYTLAYGDARAKAQALSVLDTLNWVDAGGILGDLWHPRFLPATADAYARMMRRSDATWRIPRNVFMSHLEQGKFRTAMTALDHPALSGDVFIVDFLVFAHDVGFPVPEERLERALAFGPADTLPSARPFFAAGYAAERGRWDEYQRAVARAEADAERFRAEGDSVGERFTRGMLRAMDGLAAWRRGDAEEALVLLEVGRREATGFGYHVSVNNAIRYYLGVLHLEQGNAREAIRYLESFNRYSPLANYSLARAYEAAGERDKARAAYELFLDAWRDADPDPAVQKLVAEARAGLGRLGFRPRD